MKEMPIGSKVYHPVMGELEVAPEGPYNNCVGCVFMRDFAMFCGNEADKRHTGFCSAERRSDKKGVIFIKHKEI